MKKRFSIKYVLYLFLSVIILISAFFCFSVSKSYAAESNDGTIENLYDETLGKFYFDTLNQLAAKVGYSDVNAMATAAKGGTIKTAKDFGKTKVKFGKKATDNSDLEWFPAYLSNSDEGPILTLWLASNDIYSFWGDGTFCTEESVTPSSNNYSTSMIRVKTLNNGGTYYCEYASNWAKEPTAFEYTPTSDKSNPFEMYTTGALAKYITTPSSVSWQATANHQKNDPLWNANSKGHYTPTEWLNDKLWLPSVYEAYDKTAVPAADSFLNGDGLWCINDGRFAREYRILRSANPNGCAETFGLVNSYVTKMDVTGGINIACPALHLNLTKAVEDAVYKHNHSFGEWEVTTAATCSQKGLRQRVCTADGCMLENGIETEEIEIDATAHSWGEWQITPATCTSAGEKMRVCKNNAEHTEREVIPAIGHEFSTKFTIDTPATCTTAGSKSKHCTHAGCNEKMEVTEIAALQHDWGEWTVETAVTCEQDGLEKRTCKRSGCGESETRAIVHEGHKYVAETTPPTCTEDGYTTHTCSVCGNSYTDGQVTASGHKYVAETTLPTCTEDGYTTHTCIVCGNSYTDGIIKAVGHSYGQPLWEWNGYLSATAAFECGNCNDCQTVPAMIANKVTKEPTYTEQGERTYTATVTFGGTDYTDSKTEAIDMNSKAVNSITFQMSNAVYGEEWEPSATALYGTVNFSYSDELGGTYAATKPQNAGTYYVKASVEEGETYLGAEVIKEFKITPREITVTINSGSSIAGDPLETLTATVTVGSVIDGDNPYTLSTNADMSVVGTYAITGTCTDGNYSITFVDGVYIVSQRASDPSGGGEIDIPRDDIDVEFKLTQSSTDRDYSTLDGMKKGYWAQLWYRNEDGTLGDEFTDKMNCVLTLKIPTEIIEGIRGGEKIDRDKIAAGLGVYYVEGSEFVAVKAFTIAQKDDSWIVKFNYNAEFPAEIVFNAAEAEDGQGNANGGTPWWVWLLVCLGGAAVIGVIVVIIVVAKKKNTAAVAAVYDDAELKAKLTEQDRKLDEIKEIVDGGFNDLVDGE